jgi:hypothetical protein
MPMKRLWAKSRKLSAKEARIILAERSRQKDPESRRDVPSTSPLQRAKESGPGAQTGEPRIPTAIHRPVSRSVGAERMAL